MKKRALGCRISYRVALRGRGAVQWNSCPRCPFVSAAPQSHRARNGRGTDFVKNHLHHPTIPRFFNAITERVHARCRNCVLRGSIGKLHPRL